MMRPSPRTTRLTAKPSRIALCCMLASALIAAPVATGGGLENFYNSVSAYNNVTGPQAYEGQVMNVYTGGSLFMRTPNRNYQLFNVAAPSLRAGCGGIDVFGGSFSFINTDQFVALLRNIGQNALGIFFMTALQAMAPEIMEMIKYLNNLVNDINNFNINSCEIAKNLVAGTFPEMWHKANANNAALSATKSGLFSDWAQARLKMFGDDKEVEQKSDSLKATDQDLALKLIEGNLVWKAINRGSLPEYLSEKERRMVMSAIGAVVVNKTADGKPVPSFRDATLSFKRLVGKIDDSDNSSKPRILTCLDGHGADECTILGEEPFDGKPFSQLAYERMYAIYERIVSRGPALTQADIDFINATSVPVYKILAVAASMHTQAVARDHIKKNADVIGAELAAAFMLKALDEAERALEHRSKVSTEAEAKAIKDIIDKLRDRRRTIHSEMSQITTKATGIYSMMVELHHLEKALFGNLSEGVAANLRFAQSMRQTR